MKRFFTAICFAVLLATPLATFAKGECKPCNIVYIGNSITYGALHKDRIKTAPPVQASEMVGKGWNAQVEFRNCARSGATTYDFLPDGGRDWPKVAQAMVEFKSKAEAGEPVVFSIMLGTNDSAYEGPTTGSPVSRTDYKKNLLTIIEACRNSAMYLAAGLKRLNRYIDALVALANEFDYVYLGDVDGYSFFEKHHERYHVPEEGNAGTFYLHPNEAGAKLLAKFWSRSIIKALNESEK